MHSIFVGVIWFVPTGKWKAQLIHEGQHFHIGLFDNELDAMKARLELIKKLRGEEFAYHNIMKDFKPPSLR